MVPALDHPSHRSASYLRQLDGAASFVGHDPGCSTGAGLVGAVSRDRSCRLQKSAPLSSSEALFLVAQFRFKLFDQLGYECLKFRLAPSKCRFMTDRFVAHAQIGQHQLKCVDSGVAVQGFSLQARRGYDIATL